MKKFFALTLVLLRLGCGGDELQPPTTQPDQSVWSSSVSVLIVADGGGGFVPQPPKGSTCLVGAKTFTLTVASSGLAWTRCVGDGSVPYTSVPGSRVLSATELKDLGPLLENLRVVKPTGSCIADASMLTVNVTNPLGTQDYVDDGFQCVVKDKPLIDRSAISKVLDRLNMLATPTM